MPTLRGQFSILDRHYAIVLPRCPWKHPSLLAKNVSNSLTILIELSQFGLTTSIDKTESCRLRHYCRIQNPMKCILKHDRRIFEI